MSTAAVANDDDDDCYEPLSFPRTDWPATYYYPRMAELSRERRTRYAARQASGRFAAVLAGDQPLDSVDMNDFDMAIVDVVLELNDQFRDDWMCESTKTVAKWHACLRELTAEAIEKAQERLAQLSDVPAAFDAWCAPEHAAQLTDLVIAFFDQMWRGGLDSKEFYPADHRAPWSNDLELLVARYYPKASVEHPIKWSGTEYEPTAGTVEIVELEWDGTQVTTRRTGAPIPVEDVDAYAARVKAVQAAQAADAADAAEPASCDGSLPSQSASESDSTNSLPQSVTSGSPSSDTAAAGVNGTVPRRPEIVRMADLDQPLHNSDKRLAALHLAPAGPPADRTPL
ncbi:uncharacterized protein CcaverHIS019_0600030 [Cutaneotrichosporon cavernicola]|uniref:Uncharacterized protein n=1 Tax=Cutaneotrichosporon cavernicola TaxID=279322 RepID=A0AA48L7Q5_9TREE|nr:uncharacterized protein CcaverHIS019_0600030 [Cutaneotrichosporon cavernicola]BEI93544.1 hypothetical protein CcaverHIS019_0600030 [Cutaneotrichosporon cavernicola]BEJ09088.1 hypothetical protein CcaverHIS641_0600030 [Cutaneotrichosporon cavernicola]